MDDRKTPHPKGIASALSGMISWLWTWVSSLGQPTTEEPPVSQNGKRD